MGGIPDDFCKTKNNCSKQHTQRRGIGDIIELAFTGRLDRCCDFKYIFSPRAFAYISYNLGIRTEESYRLVAFPGNPDAQSDTLVLIPSGPISDKLQAERLSIGDPMVLRDLYWSTSAEKDHFSIIGFAGEFKKDEMKQHSGVASGVVLTVESGVGQKPGKALMRAMKAEEAITVAWKQMDSMATSTWIL